MQCIPGSRFFSALAIAIGTSYSGFALAEEAAKANDSAESVVTHVYQNLQAFARAFENAGGIRADAPKSDSTDYEKGKPSESSESDDGNDDHEESVKKAEFPDPRKSGTVARGVKPDSPKPDITEMLSDIAGGEGSDGPKANGADDKKPDDKKPDEKAPKDKGDDKKEDANKPDAPDAGKSATPADAKDSADAPKADEAEVIPPPPQPTEEQLAKRRERAIPYQTLGEQFFQFPVTGSLASRYRFRNGPGESDSDIYELLTLDVGDKERQPITGHLDARVAADFTPRNKNGVQSDIFTGLVDTYSSAVDTQLYSAYADFNKLKGLELLRVGRQFTYDTPEILEFDGVRVDTDSWCGANELKFSFYGGASVHTYESSAKGDTLAGAAVEAKPWNQARLRLDYVHADDNFSDQGTQSTDLVDQSLHPTHSTRHDDVVSLSFWQTLRSPNLQLQAEVSQIDGKARDAMLRTLYNNEDSRLQVSSSYQAWFRQDARLTTEFDYFFDTLAGEEPYHNANLSVNKGWTDNFWTEGGVTLRRLMQGAQAQIFNHEFDDYYATLQLRDLPVKGLTFSVTGSRWDGKGEAPNTNELGGEIAYACKRKFQSAIGTDYSLYKYDLFTSKEDDQVRTYYLKQRWRPTPWASLDVKFEHEISLYTKFNTATVSFRFDF